MPYLRLCYLLLLPMDMLCSCLNFQQSIHVKCCTGSDKVCDVGTVDLLEEEIDLVIKGLKDAKKRMMEYRNK